jgi:diguanylate cyclase (GGDEF)-like protein
MPSNLSTQEPTITKHSQETISLIIINLLPLIGFITGILLWLIDAFIDTHIHHHINFWTSVTSADETELWMRLLVVIVTTASAIIVQNLLRKQDMTRRLLIQYQNHLESQVAARTRELEQLANLDVLTAIYNRRKATDLLEKETERAARYQQALSLVLFDLDFFKQVNDTHGHMEGDLVLKEVGETLRQNLRQSDIYARWGGEEFIIIMPHTNLETAKNVATKLQELVRTITYGDGSQTITASFGIAQHQQEEQSQSLLRRADDALYEAKNKGRDTIILAE